MKNKEVTDEEVIKAIKRARNPATIDYVEKKLSLRNKAVAWRIIRNISWGVKQFNEIEEALKAATQKEAA